jgi:hypothetical protein
MLELTPNQIRWSSKPDSGGKKKSPILFFSGKVLGGHAENGP